MDSTGLRPPMTSAWRSSRRSVRPSSSSLELSPAIAERARAAVPDAEVVVGDAAALPFAADSFDVVLAAFGVCAEVMAEAMEKVRERNGYPRTFTAVLTRGSRA